MLRCVDTLDSTFYAATLGRTLDVWIIAYALRRLYKHAPTHAHVQKLNNVN